MIHPDRILTELSDLWVSLGREYDGASSDGVLRACAMTLVVLADAGEDESVIGETIAALMKEHPSRAVVVRVSPAVETPLASRVFAQCWMPFGRRQQICCEQIEITSSERDLAGVPAVVLPLAVADLPVILWDRLTNALPVDAEAAFSAIATKTIVDTSIAGTSIAALAARAAGGAWFGDLTWTRITRWRELIAQVFENPIYCSQLASINRVVITHSGAAVPPSAHYLGAWLAAGLESAGAHPVITFAASPSPCAGNLANVELSAPEGIHISITRSEGATAEIRVNHLVHRTVFPKMAEYEQLRDELSITVRDRVFERVLPRAAAQ